ncbi:hypothetical protein TNCT_345281 [Trichonephila clavata]|uniref:Uncharacterized protein n=1 Tax=Trichonephila clavata TaxID=2740835 RepID=A0A8X6F9S7_TRICU|nr:hypothetical protein TNCT_345281 [Trichonephila clavata]
MFLKLNFWLFCDRLKPGFFFDGVVCICFSFRQGSDVGCEPSATPGDAVDAVPATQDTLPKYCWCLLFLVRLEGGCP